MHRVFERQGVLQWPWGRRPCRPVDLVDRFRNTSRLSSATDLGRGGSQTRPYEANRVVQRDALPRYSWEGTYESIH